MTWVTALLVLAGGVAQPSFTADLFLTNEPGTLFMRWEQGRQVELASVTEARRGEPIAAIILFSGCTADEAGHCNLTMDIQVVDPRGQLYGESNDTELWVGRPPPAPGTSQLGVGYLLVNIEPDDPSGTYRVKADVSDQVAGRALPLEREFSVQPLQARDTVEWPTDKPKPDLSGFWKDHCEDNFGLKIEPASGALYSVSFCGPGGCFEPGTYRPDSQIFGDEAYRVIDPDTIEVLGSDGFSTYHRCGEVPAP